MFARCLVRCLTLLKCKLKMVQKMNSCCISMILAYTAILICVIWSPMYQAHLMESEWYWNPQPFKFWNDYLIESNLLISHSNRIDYCPLNISCFMWACSCWISRFWSNLFKSDKIYCKSKFKSKFLTLLSSIPFILFWLLEWPLYWMNLSVASQDKVNTN